MKNIKKFLFVLVILFSVMGTAYADEASVNLTIRDGNTIIFSGNVILKPIEVQTIELNGHSLDAKSVLSVLNDADIASENFSITDLQYYESFGSFYIRCINDKCDNWQYVVNDVSPGMGMDQKILSGGEEIYVYFSQQHRIILSSNSIRTDESLTVTTENYVYKNDSWEPLTDVAVGIIQTNPDDPFNSTEISTSPVDENGQANFTNITAGSYNVGIKEDFYFPVENLAVTETVHHSSGSSGRKVIPEIAQEEIKPIFDLNKAFDFLVPQQKENGTFGEELYTDWVTLALINSEKHQDAKTKLVKYYSSNKPKGGLLTDYERRAMAVMSLGLNPYNTNGENYIKKITDSFDGKQFGDINQSNDDIFALIVLQNAGFTKNENIIKSTIINIISTQKENGSWDDSVDMTGAGIEALAFFNQDEPVKNTLKKAKEFLKQNQKDDGGFGNVSSTAWVVEGILALSEKPEDWNKNGNTPFDYLALNQDTDGGIKEENLQNKVWQTAYVITSLSGKTWNRIMQNFEKPKESEGQSLPARDATQSVAGRENSPRIVLKKTVKKIEPIVKAPNSESLSIQNTAAVINSLEQNKIEPKKRGWFRNLLEKIFSVF